MKSPWAIPDDPRIARGVLDLRADFAGAILTCERCGREEVLEHPTGDQFFCCRQKMRKETL